MSPDVVTLGLRLQLTNGAGWVGGTIQEEVSEREHVPLSERNSHVLIQHVIAL